MCLTGLRARVGCEFRFRWLDEAGDSLLEGPGSHAGTGEDERHVHRSLLQGVLACVGRPPRK